MPPSCAESRVAGVFIDTPLLHLDRIFDYEIPAHLSADVAVGSAVRVRFARRLVTGWVVEIRADTDHAGPLAPIERSLGAPVLSVDTISLCRAVADRWVGTFADVVRTAVPPRVASVDTMLAGQVHDGDVAESAGATTHPLSSELEPYPGLAHVSDGEPLRAALVALPGRDPLRLLAAVISEARHVGGVLAVLPDVSDVARLSTILTSVGDIAHVCLTSHMGRNARWRAFREIQDGRYQVVLGTRGAAFAPVRNLRTFIIWDDAAETHGEPHAPYWHARDVLALRASQTNASFICAGIAMTAETAALIARRWLTLMTAPAALVRKSAPKVQAAAARSDTGDRLAGITGMPQSVFTVLRAGLRDGPVLVLAPRRGYIPFVSCAGCRLQRTCPDCGGPAHATATGPQCESCRLPLSPACSACGSRRWRAVSVGQDRLIEHFGRAFPGVRIIGSNADRPVAHVPQTPAICIATAGCEPLAAGGFTAVVALDVATWLTLPDMRAEQFAFTRLAAAMSRAKPGASAVLVAESNSTVAQALIRWDPVGFAQRQLAEREQAHLNPSARVVSLRGAAADILTLLEEIALPSPSQVIGPEPRPDGTFAAVVSVPWRHGAELSVSIRAAQATRLATRKAGPVTVMVDPANPA